MNVTRNRGLSALVPLARSCWRSVMAGCVAVAALCQWACSSSPPSSQEPPPAFKSPFAKKAGTPAPTGPAGLPQAFVTLPSGLQYAIEKPGVGEPPKPGQKVAVNYAGYLASGKRFDASKKGRPMRFVVGENEVIEGWEEGIRLMKTGTRAWFKVPPDLAYGDLGSPPDIPPGATLVFYVELVKIYRD